uniref:Secreted protein n=1 Tax=Odontella aurita TaxID=265563 RepID=A0A7S4N1N7_9STRA|mmetsp:Transcript_43786/g.133250  ORF Transcript_43786/g.133250 Transcript_43786/m.133250 type:complete len:110 (+) Transcript_43786:828-1157(+)
MLCFVFAEIAALGTSLFSPVSATEGTTKVRHFHVTFATIGRVWFTAIHQEDSNCIYGECHPQKECYCVCRRQALRKMGKQSGIDYNMKFIMDPFVPSSGISLSCHKNFQ